LEAEPEIQVIGEAINFPQALEMCAELKPTVLLLDLHMPGDQFDAEHVKIKLLDCAKHVLAMSVWSDGNSRTLANSYGCIAFLDKAQLGTELVPAIMAAAG
jgi:DNA-binding NarL/FixJ family response regulator